MDIENFDIENYINSNILNGKREEDLSHEEYDNYLNEKENMIKNTRNLLNYFSKDKQKERFSFSFDKSAIEYFPLREFNEKEVSKFLNHIFRLKDKSNFIGNKEIYNLSKISIDDISKDSGKNIRTFDFFYMREHIASNVDNKTKSIKDNRKIIRKNPLMVKELMEKSILELDTLRDKRVLSDLLHVLDYISDLFLQIFNYWIVSFQDFSFDKKVDMTKSIESYLKSYKRYIIELNEKNSIEIGLEDAVDIFTTFLTKRNEYGVYSNILEILEEEQAKEIEFFAKPKRVYEVQKGIKVPKAREQEIITEGIHIDSYEDKLNKTKEMIEVFAKFGMRTASTDNILDIKVYFREIYLSDSKYKRQAKTIVRKYLKEYKDKINKGYNIEEVVKSFEKESDYQFLREKISRGYFRETCDIRLYAKKNKLQRALYEVLLNILLTYDYELSISLLEKLINELVPICFKDIDVLLESIYGHKIF